MIETATAGELRVVTFSRPHRRNALTRDGLDALEAAIDEATEPVLYLTGEGDAFCAGADFDIVADLEGTEAEQFIRQGQRVARAIESYDGAVVAGIDGPARGGGVELALACDLRVATPEATFAETGVELGLFGAWGGTARLPEIVGLGDAMDLSLTGRVIDAEEARQMGLVSQVVDDPRAVAERIASHDATAVRLIQSLVRQGGSREQQERREQLAFRELTEQFDRARLE